MIATKKDLQTAIKNMCSGCKLHPKTCDESACPLWHYRDTSLPKQLDIFRVTDYDVFVMKIIETAESFGDQPFYWSELRNRANIRPLHDNWHGLSTSALKRAGFQIISGSKRSTHASRRGGFDRCWKKI